MKEFNKNINLISYTIGSVKERDLNKEIYKKAIDDVEEYLKISKDLKVKILDIFPGESYVNENQREWMEYKSMDNAAYYRRDNENIVVDHIMDPNNIDLPENSFDIIYVTGNKFGFGHNHKSLLDVERIIKHDGLLIASLSKYLYYKELNQILIGYRSDYWSYDRAIEINYSIIETKVESGKYFAYYRFKR